MRRTRRPAARRRRPHVPYETYSPVVPPADEPCTRRRSPAHESGLTLLLCAWFVNIQATRGCSDVATGGPSLVHRAGRPGAGRAVRAVAVAVRRGSRPNAIPVDAAVAGPPEGAGGGAKRAAGHDGRRRLRFQ